jgi:hypothetical protein
MIDRKLACLDVLQLVAGGQPAAGCSPRRGKSWPVPYSLGERLMVNG